MERLRKTFILKLQLVQNTAARVVNLSRRRDHIKPVLKSLHWLPVNERITLKLATTVFKILSCSEPPYLRELLNVYKPTRCLRSSQKHLLTVPTCRTRIASRAFSVTALVLWNSIGVDLKQCCNFQEKYKDLFIWIIFWLTGHVMIPCSVIRTCNTVWRLACKILCINNNNVRDETSETKRFRADEKSSVVGSNRLLALPVRQEITRR